MLVAVTHGFDNDVMGTVLQDNINPIEKIEKSLKGVEMWKISWELVENLRHLALWNLLFKVSGELIFRLLSVHVREMAMIDTVKSY